MGRRQKIYYPDFQITKNLHTPGGEWMTESNIEYSGSYHKYSSGEVYSESDYNKYKSIELIPYRKYVDESMSVYDLMTKRKFHTAESYPAYYPMPADTDYQHGTFERYFAKRINDTVHEIIEISYDTFTTIESKRTSSAILYQVMKLTWVLTGAPFDIVTSTGIVIPGLIDTNRRTIAMAELDFPGISKYLLNFQEFAQ